MGRARKMWTWEEVAALSDGVTKHGLGNWKVILKDPDFAHTLRSRSNVNLKDKWRHINSYDDRPANLPRQQPDSYETPTDNKLWLGIKIIITILAMLAICMHIIWKQPDVPRFYENFLTKLWRFLKVIGSVKDNDEVRGMIV